MALVAAQPPIQPIKGTALASALLRAAQRSAAVQVTIAEKAAALYATPPVPRPGPSAGGPAPSSGGPA